ncbi:hypothetical protein CDEN61S_00158 [Castellaniella denitrificans]
MDGLGGEARAGEPQAVAGGEVGRQRHRVAGQPDGVVLVGVVDREFGLAGAQDVFQAVPRKGQNGGDGGEGGFDPGGRGILVVVAGRPGDRDQLGAQAVAPVDAAQTPERQRAGRDQFAGQALAVGQAHVGVADAQPPARRPQHGPAAPGLGRVFQVVAVGFQGGLLGGVVVVVAHLGLPVLEGAQGGRPRGTEQVGVGVSGRLQIGVQAGGGVGDVLVQGLGQPEFRQRREPLLRAQPRRAGQRFDAGGGVAAAGSRILADDGQGVAGGDAERAGTEDVAPALGDEFLGAYGPDPDAGASGQQAGRQQQAEPSREAGRRRPASGSGGAHDGCAGGAGAGPAAGSGARMRRENSSADPGRAARRVMSARARRTSSGWLVSRPPWPYRYSGR